MKGSYIGPPDDRLYNVGPCRVCGIAMASPDKDDPNLCGACSGVRPRHKKHKSIGRMLVESVCKAHRAIDGKSAVKLPAAARQDLIDRIDDVMAARKTA